MFSMMVLNHITKVLCQILVGSIFGYFFKKMKQAYVLSVAKWEVKQYKQSFSWGEDTEFSNSEVDNYDLYAKPRPLHVFVKKVLLEHVYYHQFVYCLCT